MIILDTNVISEVLSRHRNQNVIDWLNGQEMAALFLSTNVFAELYFGAYLIQDALRRDGLLQSISRIRGEFSGRTLVFGDMAAEQYGRITAARRLAGIPVETKDAMIAAICLAHGATLATRNVRDFDGLDLKLINPFEAKA
ncbi:type II toxin-antitoxin system VapC family toxin [Mesorhizobium sp. ES1-1]|uniref:type II toxin-antitoxin system VapC family toxin n=1 Tax=Mesorhizobium sp. ES1-1 TaxID=2876629 RepID=UPI001CC9D4B4|nr:type II toxin-antitoxin system VapC family toxin [Mesorhizobium sp. ES1-1]MBZ9677850.1 type II toxin-antitoxin system VapC family toxin [Mesorhizobium sp. ES1-1]